MGPGEGGIGCPGSCHGPGGPGCWGEGCLVPWAGREPHGMGVGGHAVPKQPLEEPGRSVLVQLRRAPPRTNQCRAPRGPQPSPRSALESGRQVPSPGPGRAAGNGWGAALGRVSGPHRLGHRCLAGLCGLEAADHGGEGGVWEQRGRELPPGPDGDCTQDLRPAPHHRSAGLRRGGVPGSPLQRRAAWGHQGIAGSGAGWLGAGSDLPRAEAQLAGGGSGSGVGASLSVRFSLALLLSHLLSGPSLLQGTWP